MILVDVFLSLTCVSSHVFYDFFLVFLLAVYCLVNVFFRILFCISSHMFCLYIWT